MNIPFEKRYGYKPLKVGEVFPDKAAYWSNITDVMVFINDAVGVKVPTGTDLQYFTPIPPGESYEIVPLDEAMEYKEVEGYLDCDGGTWIKPGSSVPIETPRQALTREGGFKQFLAFRRRIQPKADKFWMVLRLSKTSDEVQQVDSLPHKKHASKEIAESEAKRLLETAPNARGFVVLEAVSTFSKSPAEEAFEEWCNKMEREKKYLVDIKSTFLAGFEFGKGAK